MTELDQILSETEQEQRQDDMRLSKEEFAAMKKAERDAAYQLADQTALDVAADGGKFQGYLDVQTRFGRYFETNALLVLAQNPSATRLGDFSHWKKQNCPVKSGETGISIIEPGKNYVRTDGTVGVGFDVKKVFDISQVDVSKMKPTPPKPQPTEQQLLKSLVAHAFVRIELADSLPGNAGAVYDRASDTISVQRGMEFSDTFRNLAQELALADLTTGPDTQANPYFSAYCASYMLCQKYGVDTQSFSFDDVEDVLGGMDVQEIKGELSQIRDAAAGVSERMSRTLEPQNRGARDNGAR